MDDVRQPVEVWEVRVAGEPVFIPQLIFTKTCLHEEQGADEWCAAHPHVLAALRRYEFSAVCLRIGAQFWLVYLDRTGSPALCGHATLGVVYSLSSRLHVQIEQLMTRAGPVEVCSPDERPAALSLRMPTARTLDSHAQTLPGPWGAGRSWEAPLVATLT